jgi:hypothetical protein
VLFKTLRSYSKIKSISFQRGQILTGIRRKDKEITDFSEMKEIIKTAQYVTLAMCLNDEPYLVSLSHGYD